MTSKRSLIAALSGALVIGLAVAAAAQPHTSGVLYGDDFESGGFEGNTGNAAFAGPWREIGETDGPADGEVVLGRGGSCAVGRCLGISGAASTRGAWRVADLRSETAATLRFDLSQKGRPGDGRLVIAASTDGGRSWTTLATIGRHSHLDSVSVDLSPFVSRETGISFRLTAGADHEVRIDNVAIYASAPTDVPSDDGPPPDHANPQGKPHTTTTSTTSTTSTTTTTTPTTTTATPTSPPPGDHDPGATSGGGKDDDTVIGIAVQERPSFAPPAWTATEEADLRARLAAADLSSALMGARELRGEREPLTGELVTFTRPGASVRSRFVPTAIFGALLAWATITGFERRSRRGRPVVSGSG